MPYLNIFRVLSLFFYLPKQVLAAPIPQDAGFSSRQAQNHHNPQLLSQKITLFIAPGSAGAGSNDIHNRQLQRRSQEGSTQLPDSDRIQLNFYFSKPKADPDSTIDPDGPKPQFSEQNDKNSTARIAVAQSPQPSKDKAENGPEADRYGVQLNFPEDKDGT